MRAVDEINKDIDALSDDFIQSGQGEKELWVQLDGSLTASGFRKLADLLDEWYESTTGKKPRV
jgi:hypothetical protein